MKISKQTNAMAAILWKKKDRQSERKQGKHPKVNSHVILTHSTKKLSLILSKIKIQQ